MKLPSVLLLSCLHLAISSVFAAKGTDSPPVQTQAPPTVNATGQCNAGYLVQGPLMGPPGRDGRDGLPGASGRQGKEGADGQPGRNGADGLPGPSGPPGPSGVDFEEIREIVRLITREEVKNLTTPPPQDPIKVVVECSNNRNGSVVQTTRTPLSTPRTEPNKHTPTTRSPEPTNQPSEDPTSRCENTTRKGCAGSSSLNPASSCNEIHRCDRTLPSGYYWLRRRHLHGPSFSHVYVYCYMKKDKCGIAGVMRVGYLNVTNTTTRCPDPLTLYSASGMKLCGPTKIDNTKCDSLMFPTHLIPYNFVCGKAVGYGYYRPHAFYYSTISGYRTIDGAYLSGLSITYEKREQRQHIWSYAAGYSDARYSIANCPCAVRTGRGAPSFVSNDFYCESGTHSAPTQQWHTSNQLWDDKGCYSGSNCCRPGCSRAPWFRKALPVEATSDIEVRWCQPTGITNDKTGIEQLEIYVY